jgi:hypothetical protein
MEDMKATARGYDFQPPHAAMQPRSSIIQERHGSATDVMARLVESARLLGTGRDVLRGDMQRREFITLLGGTAASKCRRRW